MSETRTPERVDHATSDEVNARRAGEVLTDAQALAIASWWQSGGTVGSVLAELASTRQADLPALLADIARTIQTDEPTAGDLRQLLDLYAWAVNRAGDVTYSLAEIRDGSGFPAGVRFAVVGAR